MQKLLQALRIPLYLKWNRSRELARRMIDSLNLEETLARRNDLPHRASKRTQVGAQQANLDAVGLQDSGRLLVHKQQDQEA